MHPACSLLCPFLLVWYAAAEAEAAASAATEAANKAQSAKQLSDGFAQDVEKWAAAADVPPDASLSPAMHPTPTAAPPVAAAVVAAAAVTPSRPVSGRNSSTTQTAGKAATGPSPLQAATAASATTTFSSSGGDGASELSLRPAGCLPAALVPSLHEEWAVLERTYVEGMGRGFAGLREAHAFALNQVAANRSWFSALLQQPDNRQALLQDFILCFNAVELDMRRADETKVRSVDAALQVHGIGAHLCMSIAHCLACL